MSATQVRLVRLALVVLLIAIWELEEAEAAVQTHRRVVRSPDVARA